MRKYLLITSFLISGTTLFGQFVNDNAPIEGEQITMYVLDSLTLSYEEIVGTDVVWPYHTYGGYDGLTKVVSASAANSSIYTSHFPSSETALEIEDFITTFYTSNNEERVSQGYTFLDPVIGEVIVRFNQQQAQLYTYPFDFGSSLSSNFIGTVDINVNVQGTQIAIDNRDCTGTMTAAVDGVGTLKLPNGDVPNVYRYKLVDDMQTTIDLGEIVLDLTLHRVQFEYYDFEQQNLPIFIHSFLLIQGLEAIGIEVPPSNIVISSVNPESVVGVEENAMTQFNVYPNPSSGMFHFKTPENQEVLNVVICDQQGRSVKDFYLDKNNTVVDLSYLQKGLYFVTMSNGEYTESKSIILK